MTLNTLYFISIYNTIYNWSDDMLVNFTFPHLRINTRLWVDGSIISKVSAKWRNKIDIMVGVYDSGSNSLCSKKTNIFYLTWCQRAKYRCLHSPVIRLDIFFPPFHESGLANISLICVLYLYLSLLLTLVLSQCDSPALRQQLVKI